MTYYYKLLMETNFDKEMVEDDVGQMISALEESMDWNDSKCHISLLQTLKHYRVDDCRVWAYSLCEIGKPDNFLYGNNIDDFIKFCANPKENYYTFIIFSNSPIRIYFYLIIY